MKRKCVEDLLQLPPIEERHMIPALRLMNLLSTLSASGKRTLCPLICFKSVQLNMKYGMTEGTPASIALYGALLLRFGVSCLSIFSSLPMGDNVIILHEIFSYDVNSFITLPVSDNRGC